MVNTNTNTAAPRATYRIKRRTPRARGLSWAGTILFILTIPAIFSAIVFGPFSTDTQIMIYFGGIFILFALAIAFWIMSGVSQNGVLSFYDDRIVSSCGYEKFEMMPGQVSAAMQSGNVVKIVFSGRTLTLVSFQAAEIVSNVNAFIAAYSGAVTGPAAPAAAPVAAPVAPVAAAPAAPAAPVVDKAEEIRKYKQLVDDGVISQEQFDAIIKKMM